MSSYRLGEIIANHVSDKKNTYMLLPKITRKEENERSLKAATWFLEAYSEMREERNWKEKY